MSERNIVVRLAEVMSTPNLIGSVAQISEAEHGPLRFTPYGVAFRHDRAMGGVAFVPWANVNGVEGWEPPTGDERKGK